MEVVDLAVAAAADVVAAAAADADDFLFSVLVRFVRSDLDSRSNQSIYAYHICILRICRARTMVKGASNSSSYVEVTVRNG